MAGTDEMNMADPDQIIASHKSQRLELIKQRKEVLDTKLYYLKLLKKHYEEDVIGSELDRCVNQINSETNERLFVANRWLTQRVSELSETLRALEAALDEDIKLAQARLEQFKGLDEGLLRRYWRLRDDVECREMLIKLSQNNDVEN